MLFVKKVVNIINCFGESESGLIAALLYIELVKTDDEIRGNVP
jgi:hypothetical protein